MLLGEPCVAHLVCPIPIDPLWLLLFNSFSRSRTFPAHFVVQDVVDAVKELGERIGIYFNQRSIFFA